MKKLLAGTIALALFGAMAVAQQNPDSYKRDKENAQERASHINDAVDIVNGPNVEGVTPNSAWLSWQTNKTAATRVRYGTNRQNPGKRAYIPGGSTQHRVQLNGLQPHSTYYYEIETRNGSDRFKGHFQTP